MNHLLHNTSPSIFATRISLPSIETLIIFPGGISDVFAAIIFSHDTFYLIIVNNFLYMDIREATSLDKNLVLKFCKDTFSWGDYIDKVWSSWLDEGNLFLFEKKFPIGICHAFYFQNQIWIEGIRIDPNFQRQKIASKLVTHAELIGKNNGTLFSYMLIDTENKKSISMANYLNYEAFQIWNYYSLIPKKNSNF